MNPQQFAKIDDLSPREQEIIQALWLKYSNAIEYSALLRGHQGAVVISPDGKSLLDPSRPAEPQLTVPQSPPPIPE